MRIRIRDTGAVVYEGEFRDLHPNTSFPLVIPSELLAEFGADPVFEGPQPTLAANQYARYDGVQQDTDGNWMTHYVAVDYTAEELAAQTEQWRQSAVVTPFQGRMALADAGLLANVLTAIEGADEKTKTAWEYALEWKRNSPMITTLMAALSISDSQADDLFKAASQITA